jgi:hypothetical protein
MVCPALRVHCCNGSGCKHLSLVRFDLSKHTLLHNDIIEIPAMFKVFWGDMEADHVCQERNNSGESYTFSELGSCDLKREQTLSKQI